jgi:group I intron endonuclease
MITCLANGRFYIGQSTNIQRRWKGHRSALQRGTHANRILQGCFARHGMNCLKFEVLRECKAANLDKEEQAAIADFGDLFQSMSMNFGPGGTSATRGRKHSEETRRKISEANKGRKLTLDQSARASAAQRNKPSISEETRAKYSAAQKRLWASAEHRSKQSQSRTGMKRPPFSEEHRRKLREANLGKILSAEHRKKITDGLLRANRQKLQAAG